MKSDIRRWKFGGTVEKMMHETKMFDVQTTAVFGVKKGFCR